MDPDETHEDFSYDEAHADIARAVEAVNQVLPIMRATGEAIASVFPDMAAAEAAMNGEYVETWFTDLPESVRNSFLELGQANFRLTRAVGAAMTDLHERLDALRGE